MAETGEAEPRNSSIFLLALLMSSLKLLQLCPMRIWGLGCVTHSCVCWLLARLLLLGDLDVVPARCGTLVGALAALCLQACIYGYRLK